MTSFPSMGHRAWFAYQCLDRDSHGQPPSYRSLEVREGLSNNTLRKLIFDQLKRPGWLQLERMAKALRVSPEWLQSETGPGPVARWPVPPRPEAPRRRSTGTIPPKARAEFERDADKLKQGRRQPGRQGAR